MIVRLVGFGIQDYKQITLGALEELKSCRKVLALANEEIVASLRSLGVAPIQSVKSLYKEGEVDTDNYDRLMEIVLATAREFEDIAFAIPGHPCLGVTLLQRLSALAAKGILTLKVVPGISSFDNMLADLRIDPIERGTAILDANRLLLFDYELNPSLETFIYHVCSVGERRTFFNNASLGNRIDLLKAKLLQYYPLEHKVILVGSAENSAGQATLTHEKLSQFENLLPKITFSTTLYIPALRPKTVNKEFLKLIHDSSSRPSPSDQLTEILR